MQDADDEGKKTAPRLSEADRKFIDKAKRLFKQAVEADNDNRLAFQDDMSFYDGKNHWPENIRSARENDGQACLTINRMKGFVRQVTNDERQNRPGINVKPVDDKADVDTANVLKGIIKHIEVNSHADIAYDMGFFQAVAGGFGGWRVLTEFAENSFEQDIKIATIPSALSIVGDPSGRMPDGSDWEFCFVYEDMRNTDFDRMYPKAQREDWEPDDVEDSWTDEKTTRVCEYFYYEYQDDELLLLDDEDAQIMYKSDYDKDGVEFPIAQRRAVKRRLVKWAKLSGGAILERGDWAGKYIPIIPVLGDYYEVEGEVKKVSLIRDAKDPQRMYNYYRSTETELQALQPKAPFVGTAGQFKGYEEKWQAANRVNFSYLEYNPESINGSLVSPPQRQGFAGAPSGVIQGAINAEQDMMGVIGIHEAGLGQQGNETSGKAILARQKEGDTSTYHFADNMNKSIRRTGEVLVDLIPRIYDTPRVARILGEDGGERMVKVNEEFEDKDKNGNPITRLYQLGLGKYDVVCEAGASYNTKRQETAEAMMQATQSYPQLMEIAGDLMVEAMDWPKAKELAERLRKTLPPELRPMDDEEREGLPPVEEMMMLNEQLQAQMQEMGQVIEQMDAELQSKQAEEAYKAAEIEIKRFDAETKRIAATKGEVMEGLSEKEKLEFEAAVKMEMQQREIESRENMKLLDVKKDLAASNQDPNVGGYDDELNPLPTQHALDMSELKDVVVGVMQQVQDLGMRQQDTQGPITVERDDNGRPVFATKGNKQFRIVYDDNSNIVGMEEM